jgi:transposase-like protein
MKLHKNASLTPKKRQQIKDLYASGNYNQTELATKFGVTRKTISKWIHSPSVEDSSNVPHKAKTITAEFIAAVKAYREDSTTSHHGKVRIALELKDTHTCSNPSNVYAVLKQLQLNRPKKLKARTIQEIPVGKHRTQMDIQVLPATEGNGGYEYKISIIHLSTRIKYSEIHSDHSSKTIASVYERALDNLPPFL